ncbi:MAG: hypothetical protein UDP20_06570 [Prevotella sp.]|nr:hypothetical protein [Prevotella sp.]
MSNRLMYISHRFIGFTPTCNQATDVLTYADSVRQTCSLGGKLPSVGWGFSRGSTLFTAELPMVEKVAWHKAGRTVKLLAASISSKAVVLSKGKVNIRCPCL